MFLFKKRKKENLKFSKESVLRLLEESGYISTAILQHTFGIGYGDAALMIDTLAEKGYVMHDGHRWVKYTCF